MTDDPIEPTHPTRPESAGSAWDPNQYGRFQRERSQPFRDLVDLVRRDDAPAIRRAVDLGCGTGALTAEAAAQLGVERMTGIDSSPAMLARAADSAGPGVAFEPGDIAEWTAPGDVDLVLANAALHWVPDHPVVLERWWAAVAPGGQLAVQVPANADHASHLASVAVADTEPFRSAFGADGPPPDPVAANVLAPERYAEILHGFGAVEQHVRLQVYPHVLASTDAVVEWTKGTSLTRFFARLPADLHEPFVAAYRQELLARLGEQTPFLYTFKRILMWARRSR